MKKSMIQLLVLIFCPLYAIAYEKKDQILILDFDSQYSQLIARRVRQMGVYCEVHPATLSFDKIKAFAPKGIILSGGPQSVHDAGSLKAPQEIFSLDCPILGICYGMQAMAYQLGGTTATKDGEFGETPVSITRKTPLFSEGICQDQLSVWMSHNDQVIELPAGFRSIAESARCANAAMENSERQWYGIQFHAEVDHTPQGQQILKNFVLTICNVASDWQPENIIEASIAQVKKQVGDEQVILALSGGVDSSVVAALLHKAIGDQLHCVFVDTGLLRIDEHAAIRILQEKLGIKIDCIDASERFLHALDGVTDPEQKRKIIGHMFIDVFQEYAAALPNAQWLAQGTIYPDMIESAKHLAGNKTIKSHHNVGGLPEKMHLKLLEPIANLFKDEVRQMGKALGLPSQTVYRHPFPGPGLAVRIMGEIKKEYLDALRKADAIFLEELHTAGLYDKVGQAFAVFLPVKTVGVKGDCRHYGNVITLRAVTTSDFMTADWADLPHQFLGRVANRIVNEIETVARVTYDITSKPPATIEWE